MECCGIVRLIAVFLLLIRAGIYSCVISIRKTDCPITPSALFFKITPVIYGSEDMRKGFQSCSIIIDLPGMRILQHSRVHCSMTASAQLRKMLPGEYGSDSGTAELLKYKMILYSRIL